MFAKKLQPKLQFAKLGVGYAKRIYTMLHATLLIVLYLAAVADAGSPVNDGQSCSAEGGGFQCIDSRKMVSMIPPAHRPPK